MKMLEEILSGNAPGIDARQFRDADIQPFRIDNVAEYLYAQTDQEVWDVKRDFPCLAPPFPEFWMEFHRPSKIVSNETGTQTSAGLPYRVGLWFSYTATDQGLEGLNDGRVLDAMGESNKHLKALLGREFTQEIDREIRALIDKGAKPSSITDPYWDELSPPAKRCLGALHEYARTKYFLEQGDTFREKAAKQLERLGVRWAAVCHVFAQAERHQPIVGPLVVHTLGIGLSGEVLEAEVRTNTRLSCSPERLTGLTTLWFSGLLAISFCHCRNVNARSEEKPAALKKRQQERGRPSVTFKVLEIEPMKAVLNKAVSENHTGLQRALHICRGHFANYDEKGLFGKYHGRFWMPQHLRGSIKTGVVVKDYDVKRPARKGGLG
jgi:hypothetical protein